MPTNLTDIRAAASTEASGVHRPFYDSLVPRVTVPLPIEGDMSLVSLCGSRAVLVDALAAQWSEHPHLIEEIDETDFALWRSECKRLLPAVEYELLATVSLWEIMQAAAVLFRDGETWSSRAVAGKWGERDLLDGVPAPPEARERIVREGLEARDAAERVEAQLEDALRRAQEEPPFGAAAHRGFWRRFGDRRAKVGSGLDSGL